MSVISELRGGKYDLDLPSKRSQVSPEEWQVRVDLAACYRLVALWGMTDMIANHISVRVPGEPEHFLINAYGLLYEEITASEPHQDRPRRDHRRQARLRLRREPRRLRDPQRDPPGRGPTRTASSTLTRQPGIAVSSMKCGFLPMSQTAMRFTKVGYHDYEGVAVNLEEQERLVADLGDADLMVLRNHGLLVVAPTIPQAFSNIYRAELACKAQVMAMTSGTELVMPSPEVIALTNHLYRPEVRRPFGVLEWPALLRKLDRIDPTYRD